MKAPTGTSRIRSRRRRSTAGSARKSARSRPKRRSRRASASTSCARPRRSSPRTIRRARLLTFRGWALHDRTTLALQPPAAAAARRRDRRLPGAVHASAARRRTRASRTGRAIMRSSPGSRRSRSGSSCSATTIAPIRKTSTRDLEWGWRHALQPCRRWSPISASGAELKAQALQGRTQMGYRGRRPALDRQPLPLGLRAAHAAVRQRSGSPRAPKRSARATAAATVGRRI